MPILARVILLGLGRSLPEYQMHMFRTEHADRIHDVQIEGLLYIDLLLLDWDPNGGSAGWNSPSTDARISGLKPS